MKKLRQKNAQMETAQVTSCLSIIVSYGNANSERVSLQQH